MIKKILFSFLLIILGFVIGWLIQAKLTSDAIKNSNLLKELSQVSDINIYLTMLEGENLPKFEDMLWLRMKYSLERVQWSVKAGARVPKDLTLESCQIVMKQAEKTNRSEIAPIIKTIQQSLERN